MSERNQLFADDSLFHKIKTYLDIAGESFEVQDYIKSNLKHDFWYWQKDALQYFDIFEKRKDKFVGDINESTHLMFNILHSRPFIPIN